MCIDILRGQRVYRACQQHSPELILSLQQFIYHPWPFRCFQVTLWEPPTPPKGHNITISHLRLLPDYRTKILTEVTLEDARSLALKLSIG